MQRVTDLVEDEFEMNKAFTAPPTISAVNRISNVTE